MTDSDSIPAEAAARATPAAPDSVRAVITELGGYVAVAGKLALPPTTVNSWVLRNSIPSRWWKRVVVLAGELGKAAVTHERISDIHAGPALAGAGARQ